MLGLRPPSERSEREAFALVRGLAILELQVAEAAAWAAAQDGAVPLAADLYRAATVIYHRVRAGVQSAIDGERERARLMQQRMLAAGLKLGGLTPLQSFERDWGQLLGPHGVQRVLGPDPWVCVPAPVAGQLALRMAPRPDWGPPAFLPPGTVQLYVGSAAGAWAVVAVVGGNCERDGDAAPLFDAGGPVVTDPRAPGFAGATRRDECAGVWHAAVVEDQ